MIRMLAVGVLLGLVAGCSSVTQKAAAVSGQALGRGGEAIYPVHTQKLDEAGMAWLLQQQYDEPPVLDGFQMDYKARTLCSRGYLKDEVYALAPRKLAVEHATCVTADCRYTLVWKIRCEEVPQAPFSIFGKF